jgi:nickel/cobalt transporter (NiCoT) family protein
MVLIVGMLHVVGFVVLLGLVAPHHYVLSTAGDSKIVTFSAGLGLTAYVLGLRHAFDADHIAAIDNTTRKLMTEKARPVSVGFWFSVGHSMIVFILCSLLAIGVRAISHQMADDSSTMQRLGGLIGTILGGLFLMLIAAINLVALRGIVRVFRDMRRGNYDEKGLEAHLDNRGFMYRLLRGVTKAVRKPWQMFPVGLVFGLSFDTATEVTLLVIAGGAAAYRIPWYAILTLPILFAAGMTLLDSIDGTFMNFAYGWAFSKPIRKVFYNLTITGLSVTVAFVIGFIELTSIVADQLNIAHGPVAWIADLNLNYVGFVIVGLFLAAWLLALAVWKFGRIEHKWDSLTEEPRDSAADG